MENLLLFYIRYKGGFSHFQNYFFSKNGKYADIADNILKYNIFYLIYI